MENSVITYLRGTLRINGEKTQQGHGVKVDAKMVGQSARSMGTHLFHTSFHTLFTVPTLQEHGNSGADLDVHPAKDGEWR